MKRRIWTVRDYYPAVEVAETTGDTGSQWDLYVHGPYSHHCDGYEVAFWPCPEAAEALERLLGGDDE